MPPDEFDGTVESAATSLLVKPTAPPPKTNGVAATPRVPEGDDVDETPDHLPPPVREPIDDEPPPDDEEEDVDLDEIELELSVDGQPTKAKIKDLKARYAGEGAIEKRLQEATELRQALEQRAQETHGFLEQQKIRLRQMDEMLAQQQPQNIDWEALKAKDPGRYLLERDKHHELQTRRQRLLVEHQRLAREQEQIATQARDRYLDNENRQLLRKVPELADPAQAGEFNSRMVKAAQHYGYSVDEYNGVMDHRAMLVLRDAAAWREHQAKTKTVKEVVPKPLLKAKGGSKPATTAAKVMEAARKKAQSTGLPDDVAKTLLVRGRGR